MAEEPRAKFRREALFRHFPVCCAAIMGDVSGEVCHGHLCGERAGVQFSARLSVIVRRSAACRADGRAATAFIRCGGRRSVCGGAAFPAAQCTSPAARARGDGGGGLFRQRAGGQADAALLPCLVRICRCCGAAGAGNGDDDAPCARRCGGRPSVGHILDRGGAFLSAALGRVPLRCCAHGKGGRGGGHHLPRKDCARAAAARHGQHAFGSRNRVGRAGRRPTRAGRPCQ